MIKYWITITILLLSSIVYAQPMVITGLVTEVYDGDTFYIDVPFIHPVFGERLPIRIKGIDTPELRSRCTEPYMKAVEHTMALEAKRVLEDTLYSKHNIITLTDIERGSFFRVVATVNINGVPYQDTLPDGFLIDDGLSDWCDYIGNQFTKEWVFENLPINVLQRYGLVK